MAIFDVKKGFGACLAAGAAALAYATIVEPYDIAVERVEISLPRLPKTFDGLSILLISDLHTRRMGRREKLLCRILSVIEPVDVALLTGDLIHTVQGVEPFLEIAKGINSASGIFAVFGNSEHKNGVDPYAFASVLSENGIAPLLNRHVTISRNGADICLAGVDDPVTNNDHLGDALSGAASDMCTLLMMHSPDGIAEAIVRGVDLVFSGHTHGGQVRLPLVGAPFTHSHLGPRMSSGYYSGRRLRGVIGLRPGRTQLYVSRGVGISGMALRFMCPPEIAVITLRRGMPQFIAGKRGKSNAQRPY